jgi:hypothetical protein
MSPTLAQVVEVGSIVRFTVPGSYETDGEARTVPAIVMAQWPNGHLQLFAFNFGGPYLINAKPLEEVELVYSRTEADTILERQQRRITELENQIAELSAGSTVWKKQ